MASKDHLQKEYIGRIGQVIHHINEHLDDSLQLHELARIACFSPFHFHRIFSTITGETLNAFINRKRMERVASKLLQGNHESLSALAYAYGFKNASSFSRSFKKYFGMSPTEFTKNIPAPFSKISKVDSKDGQDKIRIEEYICSIDKYLNWIKMNAQMDIRQMPAMNLIYMDHYGPFEKIGSVYEKLFRWAGPKGLLTNPDLKTITVYHDDPKVTDISKVRQSAGIKVHREVSVAGDVGFMTIPADKYAVGRFEITEREFGKAWDSMCVWVAEKGYQSKDGFFYELYHNDHMQHPEKKFIVDICIPVE